MADALTHLKQRSGDAWLVGYHSQDFFVLAERVLDELRSRPQPDRPLTILLAERDPLVFLANFMAACAAHCHVVLANPDWAPAEWQQVFELVQPDLILGEVAQAETGSQKAGVRSQSNKFPTPDSRLPTPNILIPTGGTSGNIRFAIHTWETLMASVDGFCQYFEVKQVNSFCVLPLYHVSGLMQFLRSFTTNGQLVVLPFKAVEQGDRSAVNPKDFFLSLVPTQLQRLLDGEGIGKHTAETQRRRDLPFVPNSTLETRYSSSAPHSRSAERSRRSPRPTPYSSIGWLSRFHTILLGGAPAWSALLEQARHHRLRLAPTYGMTETASQIATLKPDDFLNGHTSVGQVLPHAQITIRNASGEILAPHQSGNITIHAKSLALNYHPIFSNDRNPSSVTFTPSPTNKLSLRQISYSGGLGELGPRKAGGRGEVPRTQSLNEAKMLAHHTLQLGENGFQPDDLGFFDDNGYLHIIGRRSDKIITGGENVFPAEIEAAIRSTGLVQDVCVIGVSDRHWGQAITAVYVPLPAHTAITTLQTALEEKLSKFKRPKHWLAVDQLPRNPQGKVHRSQVAAIVNQALSIVPTTD